MPYVKIENREELATNIAAAVAKLRFLNGVGGIASSGDLNFFITEVLLGSLDIPHKPKYDKINTAIGVLECVKLELYRRLAVPYEDSKIESEGDICSYKSFENLHGSEESNEETAGPREIHDASQEGRE